MAPYIRDDPKRLEDKLVRERMLSLTAERFVKEAVEKGKENARVRQRSRPQRRSLAERCLGVGTIIMLSFAFFRLWSL